MHLTQLFPALFQEPVEIIVEVIKWISLEESNATFILSWNVVAVGNAGHLGKTVQYFVPVYLGLFVFVRTYDVKFYNGVNIRGRVSVSGISY